MKKILSLLIVTIFAAIGAFGQLQPAPGVFNYQGVARNSVGNVLANQTISLRLTIRDASPGGAIVYQETRTVITNPFGLFNVQVGSPGATGVSGSIQPLTGGLVTPSPWATATGLKYIQVEIDPAGGTTFINIGTAQIASVPFALYSSLSNDLVLPYNKTQADAGTLFRINNSGTGVSGAIMGTTSSNANNAWGLQGQVNNTAAGAFSAGVLGTNLSTTGNGIGVFGSQNGSGWGVYGTTPSGIGVYGLSASGTGVQGASTSGYGVNGTSSSSDGVHGTSTSAYGVSGITSASNAAGVLGDGTGTGISSGVLGRSGEGSYPGIAFNSGVLGRANANVGVQGLALSGIGVYGNSSTGRAGFFENTNAANVSPALDVASNGAAGSRGIRSYHSGLGSPLELAINNSASTNNVFSSTQTGLGRSGLIQITNAANTSNNLEAFTAGLGSAGFFQNANAANNAPTVVITTNGTSATALSLRGPGIWGSAMGITNTTSGMEWRTSVNGTTYTVTKIPGSTFSPLQLFSTGGLDFSNSVGTSIMRLLDNGNVGIGNTAPTARLHVTGTFRLVDGTEALNRILRSDASGNASWVDPSAAGIVTGSGLLNRVTFWNSAATISSNPNFTWDNVNERFGIGTAAPAYKLDVIHSGADGAHIASTSSFSVVDIDANSGDAALRFQKSGVGRWNTRNRPADDYYEIFELGGGGSRFVIQDATGWVGIGGPGATAAPAYQLDVEHSGATGIRSKSNASFSVVDIDANSGDAALRFQKAGVGMWNTRNRPADDYYEIFELGGGGSRFVIQDGTGNVGIGATLAPSYKLDVEHGGATGLRVLSTSSFSVVDIDGNSGDAALRFIKAGVNKWNTRNEPVNDDYQWFELGGGGERMRIQRGSGNVGINQPAPSYKLDVNHGGATGLRVQSSASFSVIDIDGNSGDAALRFIKAGVNKWNTRNEPVNDDYQWFELGGGGERMRIQRGSGNVGINQPAPSYKLDVNHGGATGLRVQSSASFSVVDIDGNSGDAALRFIRAGVNKWNTRNEPVFDDYQIFELGGGGERFRIKRGTGFIGINTAAPATQLEVVGTITGTVKAFTIDHPLDPANKTLRHISIESPEALSVYSGNVVTDASGKAVVDLPAYFEALNKDFRYQLTVIGSFAQAIISKEIANNKFEVATNQPNVKVSWQVQGVRNDPYMKNTFNLKMEEDKPASIKGKYYHPESYGLPQSMGVNNTNDAKGTSTENVQISPAKPVQPDVIKGSSLEQPKIVPPANKPVDNSGSVAPKTEVNKAVVKPVEVKGTSVEDVPNKPVEEKKKISNIPESTKTD